MVWQVAENVFVYMTVEAFVRAILGDSSLTSKSFPVICAAARQCVLVRDSDSGALRTVHKNADIMGASLERRSGHRSFVDDPRFAAAISALERGLSIEPHDVPPAVSEVQHAQTLESLSEAVWSDVSAAWHAAAATPNPQLTRSLGRVLDRLPSAPPQPFGAAPDLRFLYHSAEHDRALNDLLSSISDGGALVVLTGSRGIGKTTLCRALVDHLDRRTLVSVVTSAQSTDDLLKRLLVDFGVISNDQTASQLASASHDDLSGALASFLESLTVLQASALIIVDDADSLPSDVLRELLGLFDRTGYRGLLQMVLVGEPGLRRRLRKRDLRGLDVRVARRIELGPLAEHETFGYVAHRQSVARRTQKIEFEDSALRDVFTLSEGVPGRVNEICTRAMAIAVESPSRSVDATIVAQVAHESGVGDGQLWRWRDRIVLAAVLVAMLIAGAAAASWVFRATLARAMAHWR
jgi:general secretion pathway protein A